MRIVSLLPSATDTIAALGAGASLVGVSHSCDEQWAHLPALTSTWIEKQADELAIDNAVKGGSAPLYALDLERLEALQPDVVVSQSLCDVCAVPSGDVLEAVAALSSKPTLVDVSPSTLADLPGSFATIGDAIGAPAEPLIERWHEHLAYQRNRFSMQGWSAVFLDWLAPPFVAGHWVPDLLQWLGVKPLLGQSGQPSFETHWPAIVEARPELLLVASCGRSAEQSRQQGVGLDVPTYFLDGRVLFSRSSPRLLDSLDALVAVLLMHERGRLF